MTVVLVFNNSLIHTLNKTEHTIGSVYYELRRKECNTLIKVYVVGFCELQNELKILGKLKDAVVFGICDEIMIIRNKDIARRVKCVDLRTFKRIDDLCYLVLFVRKLDHNDPVVTGVTDIDEIVLDKQALCL